MSTYGPNGQAPSSARYQVGAKGGKVAQAWQYIWDRLSKEEFLDATPLCEEAAEAHGIQPQSIMAHLHRMAAENLLDAEVRPIETVVARVGVNAEQHTAKRNRAHFRIPANLPPQSGPSFYPAKGVA